MQASIRDRHITKPFEFFFEMQHAAFEISDHRIIGCAKRQSSINLRFEHLLPPFKIENIIWFWHDIYCNLMTRIPGAPMRRLDIEVLFCRRIDPSSFVFAARERYRMNDPVIVHYANFEIDAGWRK